MLALLGISSVIAVITPNPRKDAAEREEQVSGTTGATGETGNTGESGPGTAGTGGSPERTETARPGASGAPVERVVEAGGKPDRIDASPGERLILKLKSEEPAEIDVPELGLSGFAGPYAPAYLDLILPVDPGRFQILSKAPGESSGEVVALISSDG